MTLKPWYVVSPEYGTVIPICDDGTGPLEYEADCVRVDAETKRDALLLGVKLMRADPTCAWVRDAENPYAGMTVEPAECEHGVADKDCDLCLEEPGDFALAP